MSLPRDVGSKLETALGSQTVGQARQVVSGKAGLYVLSIISFVESALPIPLITDPFLVAAILADRANAARLVIYTTVASVVGGLLAYLAVYYFFDAVLLWMTPQMVTEFQSLTEGAEGGIFMITILGAITPIPYTLVAFVVGALKGSLLLFLLASVLGRGVRYIVVGYCSYRFGPLALRYITKYIRWLSIGLLLLAALYFILKMWVV
jgi:membrane protein YqaA with SNARE-associated domain